MEFKIALRDYNFLIRLENDTIKIIDGNWGIFRTSFTNHMHSYYELHYVTGGQGTLITDNLQMPLKKGCFYLLPPKTYHEQWSNHADPLKEYHLAFELIRYTKNDFIWESLFQNGYYSSSQEELNPFFENIAKESAQKQYGYQDLILQNIHTIFIILIRALVKQDNVKAVPHVHSDDKRSMLIDEAFLYRYQTITLSEISNQLNLSTRQTERFIQDKYGASFSVMKLQSRLSHAAMLLSTTELPMDEIAYQVGYKNTSFFCRAFKQHYHVTPANYRKSHAKKESY